MANLPEKNITLVDKITSIPSNSNLFLNADGEFRQASVNDVIKSATVVSDTVNNAINDAMQDSIDSHFKQATGSPILLTDTADGVVTDFKAYGRSEQVQYSGKNLLKPTISTGNASGVTFTKNSDGSYTVNGTNTETTEIWQSLGDVILADEDYIVSSGNYGKGAGVFINGSTQTTFDKQSIVSNSDKNKSLKWGIGVKAGVTLNNVIIYPQLEVGTVATDYEPYVGGTASPNPDYPQEIVNVSRSYFDGELFQGIRDSNGSLVANADSGVTNTNLIPCNVGDEIKVTYAENAPSLGINFYDEAKKRVSGGGSVSGKNEITYKATNANARYCGFYVGGIGSGITPANAKKITVAINGKECVLKVKSKGKNLFNAHNLVSYDTANGSIDIDDIKGTITLTGKYYHAVHIEVEPNTDYYLNYYIESQTVNAQVSFWNDSTSELLKMGSGLFNSGNCTKIRLYLYSGDGTLGTTVFKNFQFERNTVATDYEPYKETVSYIPLSEPLRSSLDGSVKDEVSLTEVTRRFKEVVFNGSENWSYSSEYNYIWLNNNEIDANIKKSGKVICSHFKQEVTLVNADYCITIGTSTNLKNKDITSLSAWKTWLQANPITVVYELAEPITETIEPVDIVTYDNVTYLTASDNAEMELEYPTSKVAGIASIGYSKGRKAEYEVELLKAQLLELQTAMVNSL